MANLVWMTFMDLSSFNTVSDFNFHFVTENVGERI